MNIKILLPITLLSLSLLSGCNNQKVYEENIEEDKELMIESQLKEDEDINSLFDTSNLEPADKKILLNNNLVDFKNTISQGPLINKSGDILIDFETAYNALGFEIEVRKSDEDINVNATDGNRHIYIAINIAKNIKSISINNKDTNGDDVNMYILSTIDDDKVELLIPLELVAQSINSTIVEGETKNSLLLNDSLKLPNTSKNDDSEIKVEKDDSEIEDITKVSNRIFKDIDISIGDSLEAAINVFGEYKDTGSFQGSDYYVFEDSTIFTDIDTKKISAISIFSDKYPIDEIKVGDNIESIYKKTRKEIPPESIEGVWTLFYEDYKGYKAEFTLQDDKETIRSIIIYKK